MYTFLHLVRTPQSEYTGMAQILDLSPCTPIQDGATSEGSSNCGAECHAYQSIYAVVQPWGDQDETPDNITSSETCGAFRLARVHFDSGSSSLARREQIQMPKSQVFYSLVHSPQGGLPIVLQHF